MTVGYATSTIFKSEFITFNLILLGLVSQSLWQPFRSAVDYRGTIDSTLQDERNRDTPDSPGEHSGGGLCLILLISLEEAVVGGGNARDTPQEAISPVKSP